MWSPSPCPCPWCHIHKDKKSNNRQSIVVECVIFSGRFALDLSTSVAPRPPTLLFHKQRRAHLTQIATSVRKCGTGIKKRMSCTTNAELKKYELVDWLNFKSTFGSRLSRGGADRCSLTTRPLKAIQIALMELHGTGKHYRPERVGRVQGG